MFKLKYTKQAQKDAILLSRAKLKNKAEFLLNIIKTNPFQNPPYYEKMIGYIDRYSRRINKQHRLVYEIYGDIIKIISMWSHYE